MKRSLLYLVAWLAGASAVGAQVLSTQYVDTLSSGACNTGACASFGMGNYPAVTMTVSGTFTGTLTFEATSDGINWFTVSVFKGSDGALATAATSTGMFSFPNSGQLTVRTRATAWTSGTAVVTATRGYASPLALRTPRDATFITQTANADLSNEQALASLNSGIMRVANGTGVVTSLTDSAAIAANVSDETGSGSIVFNTSPALVTPDIGVATGTSLDTGQGANELYDMDQNVLTSSSPSFANVGVSNGGGLRSSAASGETAKIQAYDNDTGPGYVDFVTLTNGNSPTMVVGNPAGGGTAAWQGNPVGATYGGTGAAPGADDQLPVSDSTSGVTWRSVGDCQDSGGNHLNYTASSNTFTCGTSSGGGVMTLLTAGSGTSTADVATNVATIAISGLTALDTIKVFYNVDSITQQTAAITLYNSTDSVVVVNASQNAVVAAGAGVIGDATIRQSQAANTVVHATVFATIFSAVNRLDANAATFTTAWTGSWTLALRHGGVVAGGTLRWSWAVYKVAGQ